MDADLFEKSQNLQLNTQQLPNITGAEFVSTKKQFHTSKNQFLSTIFQSKLTKRRMQQTHSINNENVSIGVNDLENQKSCQFSIKNQYSEFYDPLNDKLFHVKARRPLYRKLKVKQSAFEKDEMSIGNSKLPKKSFVQIHQPKNIEQQNEFKLYQEQLRKKPMIPGPGAYNIAKPFAEPVYETIQKNQNIVLVRLNGVEGTSNFKSGNQKLTAIYDKQKFSNPGPGDYAVTKQDLNQKRRERTKSKLEQYAKGLESNYKFIFEVFNSQMKFQESIPNYSVSDSSNGTEYNGKPQKLQQLYQKIKRQNLLKEEKSRKFLLQKAKSPPFLNAYERKRSISQLQIPKVEQKKNHVFEFNTIDEEAFQKKQNTMKIQFQVSETIGHTNRVCDENKTDDVSNIQIKKKIKKLISLNESTNLHKLQTYNRKQHLYHEIGYFDGTQKDKINTKYNVKFEKKNQTLKKLMEPLSTPQRKFQSLEIADSTFHRTNKYKQKKPENRYNMNMLEILVTRQTAKKEIKFNLPNSRISFMNQLGLEKSFLNQTIQY